MSGAERPDRLDPDHRVTLDDVRELMGAATPHFALQLRDRLARLIADLEPRDPVRLEGERGIERLERLAREGQSSGHVQEHELPLPSLRLRSRGSV
jgi:hypothetical protein